jgi:hypothetical protein
MARLFPDSHQGPSHAYQDADGDTVTVTFSKPFLIPANAVSAFTFDAGMVDGSNATKQQLRPLNQTHGFFGDTDDVKMTVVMDNPLVFSRIASVTVAGQVLGAVRGADHYGIVPETVGPVTVGGTLLPTTAGAGNDDFAIGITGDFRVNEI